VPGKEEGEAGVRDPYAEKEAGASRKLTLFFFSLLLPPRGCDGMATYGNRMSRDRAIHSACLNLRMLRE
jgi:hypothetical protein